MFFNRQFYIGVAFGFLVALFCVVLFFRGTATDNKRKQNEPNAALAKTGERVVEHDFSGAVYQSELHKLHDKVKLLEYENRNLAERISQRDGLQRKNLLVLEGNRLEGNRLDELLVSENEDMTPDVEQRLAALEYAQSVVDDITTASESGDLQNYDRHLESAFDSEVVDAEWAYDAESTIRHLIDTDKSLAGISPADIECKTRSCRINIVDYDDQTTAKSISQIAEALYRDDAGFGKPVLTPSIQSENGTASIYVKAMR